MDFDVVLLWVSYEGEAERAVTRVFQEAADKAPCCVLIDNMDLLCYSRTAAGASELQKRVVACLLTLMDGLGGGDGPASGAAPGKGGAMQGVFVIGATARVGDIDSAVRRAGRIDKELEIGVPSSPDREAILLHLLQRAGVSVDCTESQPQVISEQASVPINNKEGLPLAIVHDVAKLAHGMVGSDLLSVVKEAFYLTLRDKDDNLSDESLMLKPQATVTPNKKPEASTTTADSIDLAIGSLASEFEDLDITDEVEAEAEAGVGEQSCPTPPPTLALSVINPGKCCSNPTGNHSETTACNRRGLITESALRRAVSKISPSALREVMIEVPSVRWTDIGGMEGVKQSLREVPLLFIFAVADSIVVC